MTATLTIVIPGRPPTPNNHTKPNTAWALTRKWKAIAQKAATEQMPEGWQPLTRCRIHVTFVLGDHRDRDPDNLIASTKVLTDGLVEAGVMVGDTIGVIGFPSYGDRYERGVQATEYRILPLPDPNGALWDNPGAGTSSTIADTIADGRQGASPTLAAVRIPGGTSSMECPTCGRDVRSNVVRQHLGSHDPEQRAARFWAKVDRRGPDDCWEWQGSRHHGYGKFAAGRGRAPQQAHRVAYELEVGAIPEGLDIDHLCQNPPCVNPAHLEPVTHRENLRRSDGAPGINARKTHCPAGHPLTGDNLITKRSGARNCRTCRNEQQRAKRVEPLELDQVGAGL